VVALSQLAWAWALYSYYFCGMIWTVRTNPTIPFDIIWKHFVRFDIYEFFHQVGVNSRAILPGLSDDDVLAVSQCQVGLYRFIIRYTFNCRHTEDMLLRALQWFEYFKQYYTCIIDHKSPPNATTKLELKPFDAGEKNTFILQSLEHKLCNTHSDLDL